MVRRQNAWRSVSAGWCHSRFSWHLQSALFLSKVASRVARHVATQMRKEVASLNLRNISHDHTNPLAIFHDLFSNFHYLFYFAVSNCTLRRFFFLFFWLHCPMICSVFSPHQQVLRTRTSFQIKLTLSVNWKLHLYTHKWAFKATV